MNDFVGTSDGQRHLRNTGVDRRTILKRILKES